MRLDGIKRDADEVLHLRFGGPDRAPTSCRCHYLGGIRHTQGFGDWAKGDMHLTLALRHPNPGMSTQDVLSHLCEVSPNIVDAHLVMAQEIVQRAVMTRREPLTANKLLP